MGQEKLKKIDVRMITELGLLIALQIILTRFLSIQTPIVRIGFGFLPLAIMAMLYGPWIGGIGAIISDLLGFAIFPAGAYFPGFTLTAFLSAFTYGILLYNKPKSNKRILISVLIICLGLNLCLDTVWLSILMGKGYMALLPTRIIKTIIMIPVEFVSIHLVWTRFVIKIKGFISAR